MSPATTCACRIARRRDLPCGHPVVSAQPNDAEPATRRANAEVLRALPFGDRADFDEAQRGFIAALPGAIMSADGQRTIWSMQPYAFETGEAPATVNPSLWRQAQLDNFHGLFKVTDRVYQIRGLDDSNMTIVESDSGLIVIDTLSAAEQAVAAIGLYYQNRPRKPVVAVIYTHPHTDHFGGVKGVVSEEEVRAGKVKIFAPDRFMDYAVADNIVAGNAMFRRSLYQFGSVLPPGERGQVDAGHGKNIPRGGTLTLIAPTDLIKESYETRTIDGVEIEFHLVPGSEAPAEMIMYFPQFKVLNMAEDTNHTMHNLYALRGAEVRDARLWSSYINEALDRYGERTDVLIAQHQWPTWGGTRIAAFLKKQRDMYKFIHDQSVRLLNRAYTPGDIAETLRMPASLAGDWSARGYYGTLSHNAKAVYQKYLGWYDANPANLSPLPPVEQARRTVDYMGGADAVIASCPRRLQGRPLSLGCKRDEPGGIRRSGQPAGTRARRRCARATGLPGRSRHVAQRLSDGRNGDAQRRNQGPWHRRFLAGCVEGDSHRRYLRLVGGAPQSGEGRRQDDGDQLDVHRRRRKVHRQSGEFGADTAARQARA